MTTKAQAQTCQHVYYGVLICARCGQPSPKARTAPAARQAPAPAPTPSQVAHAFREGEEAAYRRVLAFLAALPEEVATKGRDSGRGAAYAAQEIRRAVLTLAQDSGVELA